MNFIFINWIYNWTYWTIVDRTSQMGFSIIVGVLAIVGVFSIVLLFLYIRQRKAQERDIPPLDLLDARKLDDMVAKQVEEYLAPLLESKGYTEEQIKEILTRQSLPRTHYQR